MQLYPNNQFIPSHENVSLFLAQYGLQLVEYHLANSGIENCTVISQTTSGGYVLRIYRQHKKSDADIRQELDFVTYLYQHNTPVAPPIANTNGELLSHIEQNGHIWQAILMPHMPGEHASHYSTKLLKNLAALQASMHNLAAQYQKIHAQPDARPKLQSSLPIRFTRERSALSSDEQDFIERAKNYVVHLDKSIPQGLCHLDYDNENVLSESGNITAVLDFDELSVAPYVMCLAHTLWDITFELGDSGVAEYLAEYENHRRLSEPERNLIRPLMLARHYAVGCIDIASGQMDKPSLLQHLKLENQLLQAHEGAGTKSIPFTSI